MRFLIFDTETSGLPSTRDEPNAFNLSNYPYIIQLSYVIYDTNSCSVIKIIDNLIKLQQNVITPESYQVHKISYNDCLDKGVLIKDALIEFNNHYNNSDLVIGHNINFDLKMINVENIRNLLPIIDLNNTDKHYCTMMKSINIVKIEKINRFGSKYYKYPKLIELYTFLFNETPTGLHNAMVDLLCCLRCFCKLYYDDDLFYKNVNVFKLFQQYQ